MGSGFSNLRVLDVARALNKATYALTDERAFVADRDLRSQMRRASISVVSNIAEGAERRTDAESAHFFYIAKASAGELRAQLLASVDIGHIQESAAKPLIGMSYMIARMLSALLRARESAKQSRTKERPPKRKGS